MKFTHYSIDPVKLVKKEEQEIYEDATLETADEFILMGHTTGVHGIDTAEAIYAAPTILEAEYMYERITGEKYAK